MTYRFDENGVGTDAPNPNGYYSDDNGNWYYKNANGDNLTGAQIINGQKVFFRDNGQQVKGAYGNSYGDLYAFYDVNSGNLVTNRYVEYMGNWFYVGKDGKPVKGPRNIDGKDVFFNYRGVQAKGDFGRDGVYMPEYYYDKDNGRKVTKAGFVKDNRGLTYYLDEKGEKVLGLHEINGDLYYFRQGGAYKYTQLVTCGRIVLITSMVKSTTSINLVRLPKIALSLRKELGTISTVMVQQLPVPFKLMGKNFTSIQIMVDKLKALLHQMVTTTMKTLVN